MQMDKKCASLDANLYHMVMHPYCHPQNGEQVVIGALKTVAAASLGCMAVMGFLSLGAGSGVWERVRITLIGGGVWTVPMGGAATFVYCKCATPPEWSQKVLIEAIGITAEDLDEYKGWSSPLHLEIMQRAVGIAAKLQPVEMLDTWVRTTHALDHQPPYKERAIHNLRDAVIGGAILGLLTGSISVSLGVVDGLLLDRNFWILTGGISGSVAACGSVCVFIGLSFDIPNRHLDEMPGARYPVKLAKGSGKVNELFEAFYANRPDDQTKRAVARLLSIRS
jgi:hypothetical protein